MYPVSDEDATEPVLRSKQTHALRARSLRRNRAGPAVYRQTPPGSAASGKAPDGSRVGLPGRAGSVSRRGDLPSRASRRVLLCAARGRRSRAECDGARGLPALHRSPLGRTKAGAASCKIVRGNRRRFFMHIINRRSFLGRAAGAATVLVKARAADTKGASPGPVVETMSGKIR